MRSKTSFFNKQLYRKNFTRFAPVFLLYILCLFMGLLIMYQDDRDMARTFWFASRMAESIQVMVVVNLLFGPLIAMLLFGDLFTSRLCLGLHAMPVRRETIFGTNILSGLTFSLVPTALMALARIPLLNATRVENAWGIALWWLLAANLQFLVFFGIAVFSVFLTGNRASMLAIYVLLNCGAYLIYGALYAIYVPLLYGVELTENLTKLLTPCNMTEARLVEVENYWQLKQKFPDGNYTAIFRVYGEPLGALAIWAAVGIILLAVSLRLYRRRNLECAGDAVAVRGIRPVFQICCAIAAGVLAVLSIEVFFGYRVASRPSMAYLFLAFGLVVGWFGAGMLTARSTHVFTKRNILGFGILAISVALSIGATKWDILGIDDWIPRSEDIQSVTIESSGSKLTVTDKAGIERLLSLHKMALEDRVQDVGDYPLSYIESIPDGLRNTEMPSEGFSYYEEGGYDLDEPHLCSGLITLRFQMNNGRTVVRSYPVWFSLEEGDIVREFLSRWEVVWKQARISDTPFNPDRLQMIRLDVYDAGKEVPLSPEDAASLLEAIRLDCEERTLTQRWALHEGFFQREDGNTWDSIYISLWDDNDGASQLAIYPDSRHTVQWLTDHGCMNSISEVNTTYTGIGK